MTDPVLKDLESLRIDRRSVPRSRRLPKVLLACALLGGLGYFAYARGIPYVESALFKAEVAATEIRVVSPSALAVEWSATGYLVPRRISQVSARVSGTVVELRVAQGVRVAKGETLLVLDRRQQEAAIEVGRSRVASAERDVTLAERQADAARTLVATAKGRVATAEGGVASAESALASAQWRARSAWSALAERKMQAERARRLVEKAVGDAVTAEDLEARLPGLEETARAADQDVRTAEAQVATAKAEVASAGAEVAKAEAEVETALARVESARQAVTLARSQVDLLLVDLTYYTVDSPMDGLLLGKPPQVGEMVGPQVAGLGNTSGSIEIADLASLVVEADVPEGRLSRLVIGSPCEIVLDAFPARRHRGRTLEIVPRVNRAKASVTVKIEFVDGVEEGLLPDMAARVGFLAEKMDDAALAQPSRIVVPASALTERGGAQVVFVIDLDRVRMTAVTLGERLENDFVLVSGPPPGTRIVDQPAENLEDGKRIKEKAER